MFGTISNSNNSTNRGKTYLESHIGVFILKPIAATIRLSPKRKSAIDSKRPMINRKPQINSVYAVNQVAKTIKNLGIFPFIKDTS